MMYVGTVTSFSVVGPIHWGVGGLTRCPVLRPQEDCDGRIPETRFAKAGELSIAYQMVGGGDIDLILIPQWLSNIEEYWEHPGASYFLRRIASFAG